MFKRGWRWLKNNKLIFALLIIIIFIGIIFLSTQTYLYVNYLLGNDLVLQLQADQEIVNTTKDHPETIKFTLSISTNPFCQASCVAIFQDLSNNEIIDQKTFTIRPGISTSQDYSISNNKLGSGQQYYRYTTNCQGISSFLCHTNINQPTTRSILIVANYDLTTTEKEQQKQLKLKLEQFSQNVNQLQSKYSLFQNHSSELYAYHLIIPIETELLYIKENFKDQQYQLQKAANDWNNQKFSECQQKINTLEVLFQNTEQQLSDINNTILKNNYDYNDLISKYNNHLKLLLQIQTLSLMQLQIPLDIQESITAITRAKNEIQRLNSLREKETAIQTMIEKNNQTVINNYNQLQKTTLNAEIALDISYDLLCQLSNNNNDNINANNNNSNNNCYPHSNIIQISNEIIFFLNNTCHEILKLQNRTLEFNSTIVNQLEGQNTTELQKTAAKILKNGKIDLANKYLQELPINNSNSELLKTILQDHPNKEIIPLEILMLPINWTPLLVIELIKNLPEECPNAVVLPLKEEYLSEIKLDSTLYSTLQNQTNFTLGLSKQSPQCCLFRKCYNCTTTSIEQNDQKNIPIIFIHGHAFNKDVSAEYSLDAFSKIQQQLEQDGYLNAGSLSNYEPSNKNDYGWSNIPIPVTIKVSYYLDTYKEQSYTLVQTKSESIDSYALKLKDTIEMVQAKTGQPKVIIIAHSMGGLVARRYLEVMGDSSVDKLIMIGTPNYGIEGNIINYCQLTGAELECRDMAKSSLFLNKLNRQKIPNIHFTTIIGTGCQLDGKDSDGVVLVENSKLAEAKNNFIPGSCTTTNPLHTELLDITKYPEVYNIIKRTLQK